MEVTNQLIKNKNKNNTNKNIKSNLNLKQRSISSFSNEDVKDIMQKFHYKLYKYNELNKIANINYYLSKKENLFSNIVVKNYNKKLKEFKSISQTKFLKTINDFHRKHIAIKNKKNQKIHNKNFSTPESLHFLPKMNSIKYDGYIINDKNNRTLEKNKDKTENNKVNLCLVPLIHLYNYKFTKFNNRKNNNNILKNNIFNSKFDITKNIISETLTKTDFSSQHNIKNDSLKKMSNIFKLKLKKESSDSKTEENDMEPKIRFNNLKKELLQEKLKINKMFIDFSKQISDKEHTIRINGMRRNKHLYLKDDDNF